MRSLGVYDLTKSRLALVRPAPAPRAAVAAAGSSNDDAAQALAKQSAAAEQATKKLENMQKQLEARQAELANGGGGKGKKKGGDKGAGKGDGKSRKQRKAEEWFDKQAAGKRARQGKWQGGY